MKKYEDIVKMLLEDIKSGVLTPGERLPSERTLAKELNVSRTAIREAMASMEMMGLVEARVGEGTFIKSPSLTSIIEPFSTVFTYDSQMNNELIETRLILETETASLAAQRRNDEHLSKMKAALDAMKRAIQDGSLGIESDKAFHIALACAAGNRAINMTLLMCSEMLSPTYSIAHRLQPLDDILDEHTAIFQAVAAQDEKKARQLMRMHLISAQSFNEKS